MEIYNIIQNLISNELDVLQYINPDPECEWVKDKLLNFLKNIDWS